MQLIRKPATERIRAIQPAAHDAFMLCDQADLGTLIRRHAGGNRMALNSLAGKNETLTRMADDYAKQFEHDVFAGRGWATRDSVVGSFPNVPALLAGVPCAMRQRVRTTRNVAPLTLYLELTGSSGVTGPKFVQRGAAVLALARLLANTRPVEIWTCTTYGCTNKLQMVACQIDTAPLNVSVAAAMLCDESIRSCGHAINIGTMGDYGFSGWAYGVPELERKYAGEILAGILNPGSTMIYIPATYASDDLKNPAQWVRDMLAKYGAGSQE
jgi:hypothetical protein